MIFHDPHSNSKTFNDFRMKLKTSASSHNIHNVDNVGKPYMYMDKLCYTLVSPSESTNG